jgi:hypothetical protein
MGDICLKHLIVNVREGGKGKGITVSSTDKRDGKGMRKRGKR